MDNYSGLDTFMQIYRTTIIRSVVVVVQATGGCKVKQCNNIIYANLQCSVLFRDV